MEHKPYNGHYNYETWAVNLWIDNEEYLHNLMRQTVRGFVYTYEAAQALKDYFEEENPLASDASLWSDLLSAALSEVNWMEIAGNLAEEEIPA